ncbi:MAG TPA: RluA family pseudouridine synthase [Thermoanaerobaculia bacterium]|nr:RluA family pseudouridine synthase [Thermoanaerobaculia bacterium]
MTAAKLAASAADVRCRWQADRGDAGGRLDHALVRHFAGLPGLSRSRLQAWIVAGRVRVNGAVIRRPAGRLAAGDELAVELPGPPPSRRRTRPLAPQRLPLAILFEDEHLLALDKPAGLVVHPTGRHRDGTLVNALAWHLAQGGEGGEGREGAAAAAAAGAAGASDAAREAAAAVATAAGAGSAGATVPGPDALAGAAPPAVGSGLVHRLDRDTSGVLLVAKSRAAHAGLARAIKARALQKDYLAVVYGRPPLVRGRIELKLLRDPLDRRRVAASRTEGRSAATLYELLAESCPGSRDDGGRAGWLSLLRCRLVTGRTHQIRVHLAALGLPIVGDPLYGEPRHRGIADPALAALCRDFPRQALHAWRLGLRHPVTGQALALRAPLPADLGCLLRAAGLGGQAAAGGDPLAEDDPLSALAAGGPAAGGPRR